MELGFKQRLVALFDDHQASRAAIASYFDEHYTGSQFEALIDDDPNVVTANDLVAVSMLSVNIPPRFARWLLDREGRQAVTRLLSQVPADVDIWEEPSLLERDAPLWRLWALLDSASWPRFNRGNDMGDTKISKLLAAKRPRLVPITDRVIKHVLPPEVNYWADFGRALADGDLRRRVIAATDTPRADLSLLRRIDISLWMRHH